MGVHHLLGKSIFKTIERFATISGIGGISQSVAGEVVSRCADPNLTEEDFQKLVAEVAEQGYELTYV